MIDIHCHILPAIDDGAESLDASLQMARIAHQDGIRTIVATPHVNVELLSKDLIREKVSELNEKLAEEGIDIEILQGADTSALLSADLLREYSVNDTDYVLLEFPHSHLPQNAEATVFHLLASGLRPIITHPERNPCVIKDPRRLLEMVASGALVQVTAESLTGGFGPDSRACARFLLKRNAVHFLATDAHSPVSRRPVLSKGLKVAKKILGESAAMKLVFDNPQAVIDGRELNV